MLILARSIFEVVPWPVLVVALIAILVIRTARQHRRYAADTDVRLCGHCGLAHPQQAKFCRRCGRELGRAD